MMAIHSHKLIVMGAKRVMMTPFNRILGKINLKSKPGARDTQARWLRLIRLIINWLNCERRNVNEIQGRRGCKVNKFVKKNLQQSDYY